MEEEIAHKHVHRYFRGKSEGAYDLCMTHKSFDRGYQLIEVNYGKIPLFFVNNEKATPVIKLKHNAYELIETNTEREAIYARVNKTFSLPVVFEEAFATMTELFQCNGFEIDAPKEILQDPIKGNFMNELIQNMEAGMKRYKDSFTHYESSYTSLS